MPQLLLLFLLLPRLLRRRWSSPTLKLSSIVPGEQSSNWPWHWPGPAKPECQTARPTSDQTINLPRFPLPPVFGVASGEARMHYQLLNSKSLNMFKYFAYSSRGSSQLSLLLLILLLLFLLRHLPSGKTQKRRHTPKPWQKKWTVLKCSSTSNCCCCCRCWCRCCCSERKTTKPKLKNHQLRQAAACF